MDVLFYNPKHESGISGGSFLFNFFLCVLLQRFDLIPIMPELSAISCTSYEYRLFPNARGTGIHTDGAIFLNPTIRLSDVHCVYEFKLE